MNELNYQHKFDFSSMSINLWYNLKFISYLFLTWKLIKQNNIQKYEITTK